MKRKITYKILAEQIIKEYGDLGNNFGGYSVAGIVNPGMSTFGSPSVRQNLSTFATDHPTMQYPVGAHKVDWFNSERATAPDPKDVQNLKNKVTPDEVLLGIQYELKKQFHKNKSQAKEVVIANLKKDPKYYSSLHMMTQGDERVDEDIMKENINSKGVNVTEVEKIINELIAKRKPRSVTKEVTDAYKESVERRTRKRTYV
jgi:hypothetical protein